MPHEPKNALVIGGTSGLGLELAKLLTTTHRVVATGRKIPGPIPGIEFIQLHLEEEASTAILDTELERLNPIHTLVYAAGYYQDGYMGELSPEDIEKMTRVGLLLPAKLVASILKESEIPQFVAITSTSQWVPRAREPLYCAAKAGLAHLAHSLSFDPKVGKVLVAAPSGMKTRFWEHTDKDTSDMMDPTWVASLIMESLAEKYAYRFIKIHRDVLPGWVEIVKTSYDL
jgi:NAD(P)-dependent dehydrogenase (short-subunit alcohol dehydrogenase family)